MRYDELSARAMEVAAGVLIEQPEVIEGDQFKGRYYQLPGRPESVLRAHDATVDAHKQTVNLLRVLKDMETYGIPSVNPRFVITGVGMSPGATFLGMKPDMVPLSVSERVVDAVDYGDVLKRNDPEAMKEVELLHERMFEYVVSLIENGGDVIEDLLYSHQFVYSAHAPEGKRMILVDIEPFRANIVAAARTGHHDNETIRTYMMIMTPLVDNVRAYESATGDPAPTRKALESLIAALPSGDDEDMQSLKLLHIEMLATPCGDLQSEARLSDRISNLLFGVIDDWD